jgi:predicted dehydrogenase
MTLGMALLGTGGIAEHAFVPAVQAVDEARLVAVLSRNKARGTAFAEQHGIPEVYDNLAALLHSPQVDAVIVATPDAMHEPQVIVAARAGKYVLCEKPMTTYAGCQRMAAEGIFGSRPSGTFMCKGSVVEYPSANPFVGEVADFVHAVQQQHAPCVTLEDGLGNVSIMETVRTQVTSRCHYSACLPSAYAAGPSR